MNTSAHTPQCDIALFDNMCMHADYSDCVEARRGESWGPRRWLPQHPATEEPLPNISPGPEHLQSPGWAVVSFGTKLHHVIIDYYRMIHLCQFKLCCFCLHAMSCICICIFRVLLLKRNIKILFLTVSTTLNVLPPPTVKCQQMTVSGRHLTVLKGNIISCFYLCFKCC